MTTVEIEKGQYNDIHESVQFLALDDAPGPVIIGDCNTIHENVKIVVGKNGFKMGDWNTIHNGVFIMDDVTIGHNCWIGQGSHLDGRGKLTVGNGVTIGFNCHIWSHVARGCLLDGCILFGSEPTVIEDDVWMVGNNVHIAPGARLGRRSIILSHAVVTEKTKPECTYGGVPAKRIRNRNYWKVLTEHEKWVKIIKWISAFVEERRGLREITMESGTGTAMIIDQASGESLNFAFSDTGIPWGEKTTFFNIGNMTYTKKLTELERDFYAYIKDYKARFIPA